MSTERTRAPPLLEGFCFPSAQTIGLLALRGRSGQELSTVGIEIERKFLVSREALRSLAPERKVRMRQGYLSRAPGRTVRVRIEDDQAFLTIKGRSSGLVRPEFEYPIPTPDAEALLSLADGPLVEKIRHYVLFDGLTWEVDEFLGENAGLVVAELELTHEDQTFARPSWLGAEVTGDARYLNSHLAVTPFSSWPTKES